MVNDFLKKVEEENRDKYYKIEKQFLKNKNNEEDKETINTYIAKSSKSSNNRDKKKESLRIKESEFIKLLLNFIY